MVEYNWVFEKGFIFLFSFLNQIMFLKYFISFFIGLDFFGLYIKIKIILRKIF